MPSSLAVLLLVAAAFRAIYFVLFSRDPVLFDGPILDARIYDTWARGIASGDWLGREAFYLAPLYPYILGVLYFIFGHSFALIYMVQSLLGLVNIALIHRLGSSIFGPRAGLYAACGAALYAPFALLETKLLGATLGLSLHLVALALLVRAERPAPDGTVRGRGAWLAAGLAIGLCALALPAAVLLAALSAALTWKRPRAAAALLAGCMAAPLLLLAHNIYVARDPLPLSGQGGITFYQGNNPTALGVYNPVPGFTGSPESQAEEEKAQAEAETGRTLRRSQVSAHFFGKGIRFILTQPGKWLVIEARKLAALLGSYESSTEYSLLVERERIPWLWLPILPFAVIAGAGVAGVVDRRLRAGAGPGLWALHLYALYAATVPLIFFVSSRYRLPLVPALLIYAGGFADRVVETVRREGTILAAEAGGLALALALALVSFFPLGRPNMVTEGNVLYNIGNVLAARGLHEQAIASYDRALADSPRNAEALINRGNSLDKLGRADEALLSYRRAEEARPVFWLAYRAQAVILDRQENFDEEILTFQRAIASGTNTFQAYFLLGSLYRQLQRPADARPMLEQAVRLDPKHVRARTRLGSVLARLGDKEGAKEQYREAFQLDPKDREAGHGLDSFGP